MRSRNRCTDGGGHRSRTHFEPTESGDALAELIASRQPDAVSFSEWKKIDAEEVARVSPR